MASPCTSYPVFEPSAESPPSVHVWSLCTCLWWITDQTTGEKYAFSAVWHVDLPTTLFTHFYLHHEIGGQSVAHPVCSQSSQMFICNSHCRKSYYFHPYSDTSWQSSADMGISQPWCRRWSWSSSLFIHSGLWCLSSLGLSTRIHTATSPDCPVGLCCVHVHRAVLCNVLPTHLGECSHLCGVISN